MTFNYDISLEVALTQGLQHIERFETNDVQKFLSPNRVLHIYGAIRSTVTPTGQYWSQQGRDPTSLSSGETIDYEGKYRELLDEAYAASHGLRVIDPDDKETDKAIVEAAREEIARAERVYILGYGFDHNNSTRLGLQDSLHYGKNNHKMVFFTNFRDIDRVNKRASKLFVGHDRLFFSGGFE